MKTSAESLSKRLSASRFLFKSVWNKLLGGIPLPTRLSTGALWLAETDTLGDAVFLRQYETVEQRFIERFLRGGMVFLDVGAHHGLYSLLASNKVGRNGRVVAFEPSTRERRKLLRHLILNGCENVIVESSALCNQIGYGSLFIVDGRETGCNSLRRPAVPEDTHIELVRLETLDHYMEMAGIGHPDLIKLDVEGAELQVFEGATKVLQSRTRPIVMCEVFDIRTAPWGYRASTIYQFLAGLDFQWFSFMSSGGLISYPDREEHHANLLAVPEERLDDIETFIKD